jgi:hypothetical protein
MRRFDLIKAGTLCDSGPVYFTVDLIDVGIVRVNVKQVQRKGLRPTTRFLDLDNFKPIITNITTI